MLPINQQPDSSYLNQAGTALGQVGTAVANGVYATGRFAVLSSTGTLVGIALAHLYAKGTYNYCANTTYKDDLVAALRDSCAKEAEIAFKHLIFPLIALSIHTVFKYVPNGDKKANE